MPTSANQSVRQFMSWPTLPNGIAFHLPLTITEFLDGVVPAAVLLADRFGNVADIDELVVEQEWPAEVDRCYVGAVAGLRGGGYAGLQAADADQLVIHGDAGGLGYSGTSVFFM